jgi:formate hydrogenlyase transcriptional activator
LRSESRFELAHHGTPFSTKPRYPRPAAQIHTFYKNRSERLQFADDSSDVRVVAATTWISARVSENHSCSDLYYRFNVFPLTIPPLRERREDIPLLARYFAQKYARRMKKPIESISTKVMTALAEYHWPGNVRELENFIERAVILSRGTELEIPLAELKQRSKLTSNNSFGGLTTLEQAERAYLARAQRSQLGGWRGRRCRISPRHEADDASIAHEQARDQSSRLMATLFCSGYK